MRHVAIVFAIGLVHCKKGDSQERPTPALPSPTASAPVLALGDAERGRALSVTYECNRCHAGTGNTEPPKDRHCVQCHHDISDGKVTGGGSTERWKQRVAELGDVPSLTGVAHRLRRGWLEKFLLAPHDLRPRLVPTMPRLRLNPEQARDVAAFLSPRELQPDVDESPPMGDVERGKKLMDEKGCGTCHVFSRGPALSASVIPGLSPQALARGIRLAPDLAETRSRMLPSRVLLWLADPVAMKADSAMPKIPLTSEEIRDVVACLFRQDLKPEERKAPPARLPTLARKVTYEEVDAKVFHRTCWHCHSEPDYAIGEGGPGNSGGFGFVPKKLNVSDYKNLAAGMLDERGDRVSVFSKDKEGVPRLVAALMARHRELAGESPEVRGMPLGYPPVPMEDIQLVETWIAQGRPQ